MLCEIENSCLLRGKMQKLTLNNISFEHWQRELLFVSSVFVSLHQAIPYTLSCKFFSCSSFAIRIGNNNKRTQMFCLYKPILISCLIWVLIRMHHTYFSNKIQNAMDWFFSSENAVNGFYHIVSLVDKGNKKRGKRFKNNIELFKINEECTSWKTT